MSMELGSSRELSRRSEADAVINVQALREQARRDLGDGAVTSSYAADRGVVLRVLNDCLASEIIGALRFRRHYFMARGIHAKAVAEQFLARANAQQDHADRIAERIVQLGGEPNFSPTHLMRRSYTEYVERYSLVNMIQENLVGARVMIDSYRELIDYLKQDDTTTVRLLESLLATQEECAHMLADCISGLRPDIRAVRAQQMAVARNASAN